jgi:ATP-dependent Lon protease
MTSTNASPFMQQQHGAKKRRRDEHPHRFHVEYSLVEHEYFASLDRHTQRNILEQEDAIARFARTKRRDVPMRFRILSSNMPLDVKSMALEKCATASHMMFGGNAAKMLQWLEDLLDVPFGRMIAPPPPRIVLQHVRASMDRAVHGHGQVKSEIVNFVCQRAVNPAAPGKALCLVGPPGVAKTHLARNGIARALGLPFGMIALGGACDASFLDGHSYTYEGSRPGAIVQELIRARAANCVLFFDELDKIGAGRHGGDDISNVLLHVTDPTQNDAFRDKYFSNVPIDLSKVLFVFSVNDLSRVNRVLLDRMTIVHMNKYSRKDKVAIARKHLLPDVLAEFAMDKDCVTVSDEVLHHIIGTIEEESGVRGLKRALHAVIGDVNVARMDAGSQVIRVVTKSMVDRLCRPRASTSIPSMYT